MQRFMMFCISRLTVVIYVIGAGLINDASLLDKATVFGNMTAYTQLAIQVVMSFMMLVMIFVILPRAQVAAKRIKEVLSTNPTIIDGNEKVSNKKGIVEFKNVSFSYANDIDHLTLKNLNFTAKKGETIAIIGSTGACKQHSLIL